ncbi:hypothetical protein Thermo_01369 [Thermoplasmatales archaeon]|nr:hypothetical protein Thermo_01369 [Thermoplasmatales archaeon]
MPPDIWCAPVFLSLETIRTLEYCPILDVKSHNNSGIYSRSNCFKYLSMWFITLVGNCAFFGCIDVILILV